MKSDFADDTMQCLSVYFSSMLQMVDKFALSMICLSILFQKYKLSKELDLIVLQL